MGSLFEYPKSSVMTSEITVKVRERFADLTPMQRERVREFVRERIE